MQHEKELTELLKRQIEYCLFYEGFRSAVFVSVRSKINTVVECLRTICENQSVKYRIVRIRKSGTEGYSVEFDNKSIIKVTVIRENQRGQRVHCLVLDDAIDREIVNCIIKPMLQPLLIRETDKEYQKEYIENAISVVYI